MIQRKLLTLNLILVSIIFLCGIVLGQTRQQTDVADISNNGANVSWQFKVPYESGTLTVSAPNGEVYRKEFKAGTVLTFAPSNSGNGRYTYEIVLSPILSPSVKQALAQSRIDGNSDAVREDFMNRGVIPAKMSASGTFAFENGNLITAKDGDVEPEPTTKTGNDAVETRVETKNPDERDTDFPVDNDQQIIDDLIVVGSACIGQDCVNGESFGFDTLRLKENNLRINFQDTSNSASFPTNDWRIVANDTSNGGASYLAFEDTDAGNQPFRVEAGAGANALVVDDDGQIGLGTINPIVELHIVDGDSPTMRLEQNGSSGFSPQTWDVAGNETNFFIRDVSNGSTLPFRIQPGASNGTLNVGTSGNVGIGFGSNNFSANPLEVRNNNSTQLAIVNTSGELHLPLTGGGIRFPDGTVQTTATSGTGFGETNTGSNVGTSGVGVFSSKVGVDLQFKKIKAGPNVTVTATGSNEVEIATAVAPPLGPSYAQHIFGGSGVIASFSTIPTPARDYNTFSVGTGGQVGFFSMTYAIPYNLNLADLTASQVTFKIRFRDDDGTAAAARVQIELVGLDINTGGQARSTIFDSSTGAIGNGFQTVTVCKPFDLTNFNASVSGMHINVTVTGTAAQQAGFVHMQVYKGATCP